MADNEVVSTWWSVGAEDQATVRKYLSYLHKHSLFGGHVGLPENIRNKDANTSLDSSRGIYDMLEVYSVSGTVCPTGTLVNFKTDDTNNVEGITYVYPCIDVTKPMGYMVTQAEPDVWGVCVVQGILEVPLIYAKGSSLIERTDYVEYDVETATFKFSNDGYPVFNVYQDVDGDWIAIILFGDMNGDGIIQYDGPFAVSIDHYDAEVSDKIWINCNGGDVVFNQTFSRSCDGFNYIIPDTSQNQTDASLNNIALNLGESLWLEVVVTKNSSVDSLSFSFFSSVSAPSIIENNLDVFYIRIAKYDTSYGLIQCQYGNIFITRLKEGENIEILHNINSASLKISAPYRGPFDVELLHVFLTKSEASDATEDDVDLSGQLKITDTSYSTAEGVLLAESGTPIAGHVVVGTESPVPVIGSLSLNFKCEKTSSVYVYLYRDDSTGKYEFDVCGIYNKSSKLNNKFATKIAYIDSFGNVVQLQYGDIVQPYSGGSNNNNNNSNSGNSGSSNNSTGKKDYQDLIGTGIDNGASLHLTESSANVDFKGEGSVEILKIRRYAEPGERESWGIRSDGIAGSNELVYKGAGWRGIYHAYDGSVMTEVSEVASFEVGGTSYDVEYPLIIPTTTDAEIEILSRYVSGLLPNDTDALDEIRQKAQGWASERISEGKSTFYNFNGSSMEIDDGNGGTTSIEDEDDALRNVDDKAFYILGYGQELNYKIIDDKTAKIGLSGSAEKNWITLTGSTEGGITFTEGSHPREIVIGSTGGSGGEGFVYHGGFAVVQDESSYVKVCDTASVIGSTVAGTVWIGAHECSAKEELVTMGTNSTLYFEAWYTTNAGNNNVLLPIGSGGVVYQYTTSPDSSKNREWNKRLAYKDENGVIKQIHLTDSIEICGRWS